MYCKNCGKQIDNDSRFCMHCGSRLTGSHDIIIKENEVYSSHAHSSPLISQVTPVKTHKYDESFKRDESLTTSGIVLLILSLIASVSLRDEILNYDTEELRNFRVISIVITLLIRVVVIGAVSQYASKLNRDSTSWGVFAFFLPAISLIVIGQQKKLADKA